MVVVIDFHSHYPKNERNFPERLVELLPQAGIDRICLCSAGDALGHVSNQAVLQAAQKFPDQILAFALVKLGEDSSECVDQYAAEGFRGFKITNPPSSYDDEAHFPIYERMERSGLPLLAHTGILMRFTPPAGMRVNSRWMKPICLDAVVRAFPGLNVVGAHLGAPWHEEASMMARIHPNYYVDLTGACWGGWRANKGVEFYHYHFFWGGAWDKVLFGTDILTLSELIPSKQFHDRLMQKLAVPQEVIERVNGGTAARLLGL